MTGTQVIQVIIDVLELLAAAHDKGYVHRDIKPANIFLANSADGTPQVRLLDFGIVKSQHPAEITVSGALLGTMDDMSPE